MKALQANMHRGKVADALLPQVMVEEEVDIAIISEQYGKKQTGVWIEDDSKTSAIWIPSQSKVVPRQHGTGNCFTWVQLEDITVVSCYLTPSDFREVFQQKLDDIEDFVRNVRGHIILAGDFNAKAVEWGMQTTDSRGRGIVQMIARLGMMVANVGNVTTFRRPGCEGTIPDITLVSERLLHRITDWKVLEKYTGSDHQYISFSMVTSTVNRENSRQQRLGTKRWNVKKLDTGALIAEIDRRIYNIPETTDANTTVDNIMRIIRKGCNLSMPQIRGHKLRKKEVYWWNDDITNARRECCRSRRLYTRAKRRGEAESERIAYKEAKKKLQKEIFDSKRKMWEELREDININPWGTGYKIVKEKLGIRNPTQLMDEQKMENIVKNLFPTKETPSDLRDTEENIYFPLFTMQELKEAAKKLNLKKAPGPDGIPPEVIKQITVNRPHLMLGMYNKCLMEGIFPKTWKLQQLVLISKGKGDPNSPSAYRPLCLLDTAGKLYERLLKPRLKEAIDNGGGLSDRQHGFRPHRSTIGAIKDVVDVFDAAQRINHSSRPIIILATLDIKNAFNSLRWPDVLQALEGNFHIPRYLSKVIRSYFKERELIYDTKEGKRRIPLTSGAAQGSILGPELWNISYDDILKIEMPEDTFLVGYADDIAAVISARDTDEARRKLRQVMIRTKTWLDTHGLQLALQKTEIVVLTRKNIPTEISIEIEGEIINTSRFLNYLGIRLDTKMTFSNQIKYAADKAARTVSQLSRLMANIGGPRQIKRKLLMETSNNILLYGSEIWGKGLNKRSRNTLLAVQRTYALRIASAYRTVSTQAILVLAGTIPIDLLVEERRKIWISKQTNIFDQSVRESIRKETYRNWQTRWNEEAAATWTKRLLPNINIWLDRSFGEVDYYITQMLTGHGYFRKYLYNIGKCNTPYCLYERENTIDDAEHTFFECSKWNEKRRELEEQMGELNTTNIINHMTTSESRWRIVTKYCEYILKAKKHDLDNAE